MSGEWQSASQCHVCFSPGWTWSICLPVNGCLLVILSCLLPFYNTRAGLRCRGWWLSASHFCPVRFPFGWTGKDCLPVSGSLLVIFVLSFQTGGRCSSKWLSPSHFIPVHFSPGWIEGCCSSGWLSASHFCPLRFPQGWTRGRVAMSGCLLVIFVLSAFLLLNRKGLSTCEWQPVSHFCPFLSNWRVL